MADEPRVNCASLCGQYDGGQINDPWGKVSSEYRFAKL